MKYSFKWQLGISIFIMLVAIMIFGRIVEHGDSNAVGMYLVVFLWPALIICALNALCISLIIDRLNPKISFLAFIIPLLILALFILQVESVQKQVYWMMLLILLIINAGFYLSLKFKNNQIKS